MSARDDRDAPAIRLRTVESTARALRMHFARHNRRVILIAAGTLLAAAAAWLLLFLVGTWIFVVVVATFDLPVTDSVAPRSFVIVFIVAGLCALAYAWLDRWLTPNQRAADEKSPSEIVADFLLAVPRMTLSVGGTLGAWQRLSGADFLHAAALLHRVAEERRVPMSSVRLDIPDADSAMRILFGLQLTQMIEVFREGSEFLLRLNALRPADLRLSREGYADA